MPGIVLFSDDWGLPISLQALDTASITAIVGASVRPHQHARIQRLADGQGIPFLTQPRRNSPDHADFVTQLSRLAPDVIIINSYSMIVGEDILDCSKHPSVNIHCALLPFYRGANPIQWAILNNESHTGATMHMVTQEVDAGPIVSQRRVELHADDTWASVLKRLEPKVEAMLNKMAPCLLKGACPAVEQDESKAKKWPRRSPEDGLFTWEKTARDVYNLIRALVHPLPGAFYERNGRRVVLDNFIPLYDVWKMKLENKETLVYDDLPGILFRPAPNGQSAFCTMHVEGKGDAVLELLEFDIRSGKALLVISGVSPSTSHNQIEDALAEELGMAVTIRPKHEAR